jgi:synaptic vesicle membrane protein VAT-1
MPWLSFNPPALLNANKGVFGVNLGHLWNEIPRVRGWADELLELWKASVIRPHVDKVFPFAEAAAAHHYVQDRKNIGKVLLRP